MANVTNKQWCDIMNRIHSGRSCLTQEAQKLGMSLDELINMGDDYHKGGENERWQEWARTKRESAKRDKQVRPRKRKASTTAPSLEPEPNLNQLSTAISAAHADYAEPADHMKELFSKREELQKKLVDCEFSLRKAKSMHSIRQEAKADTRAVLEKAQIAFKNAEIDVINAETTIKLAHAQQTEVQQELQKVEEKIKELKEKTIYLVAPWFSGTFPEYGSFFSTVEMEGVNVVEPTEDIEPNFKDMVSAGFDLVSEYMKALAFISLVQEYFLEEKTYNVLNTDPRVQKLLSKHIG